MTAVTQDTKFDPITSSLRVKLRNTAVINGIAYVIQDDLQSHLFANINFP
jgi:uncharacterized LabA/DUF88 family protein